MSEQLLGAYPLKAFVHHRDRNPGNNAYENLLLLPARELHDALHAAIDRGDQEAVEATELSCLEWMEHIRRHNLLKRPGDFPAYQHRGKPLPELISQRAPLRSARDRLWDEAWTEWRAREADRLPEVGIREVADLRLVSESSPPPSRPPSQYTPIDRAADRSVPEDQRLTVARLQAELRRYSSQQDASDAAGPFVTLMLRCPGDGRHWFNAPAREGQWHSEPGRQVLGKLPRAIAARAFVDFGSYPDQGSALCERCIPSAGSEVPGAPTEQEEG